MLSNFIENGDHLEKVLGDENQSELIILQLLGGESEDWILPLLRAIEGDGSSNGKLLYRMIINTDVSKPDVIDTRSNRLGKTTLYWNICPLNPPFHMRY